MALNRNAAGASGRVERALILDGPPHLGSGEITDKGYINQTLARTRRAADIQRLFAAHPDGDVIVPT